MAIEGGGEGSTKGLNSPSLGVRQHLWESLIPVEANIYNAMIETSPTVTCQTNTGMKKNGNDEFSR